MLTKHPSYSFSCLTPYICVFCRNEENKTKSKQFEHELRKICKEESMVVTTEKIQEDPVQQNLGVVATIDHYCQCILDVVSTIT